MRFIMMVMALGGYGGNSPAITSIGFQSWGACKMAAGEVVAKGLQLKSEEMFRQVKVVAFCIDTQTGETE